MKPMLFAGVISMALDSSMGPEGAAPSLRELLDFRDRRLGLLHPPVHQKPARALGEVLAHEEDDEAQGRTDQEGDPPRVADGEMVDDEDEEERGDQRATPVRPVHGDVHAAPVLGRDELVDGRVDGRVLTTDAHAGDEAGGPDPVGPAVGVAQGQGGEHPTEQVHAEGDHEQVAPTELVRQAAEEERPDHLAEEIDGADGEGHLGGGEVQGLLLADEAFGVAGDGDLQAVQHPRHPERNDQAGCGNATNRGGRAGPESGSGSILQVPGLGSTVPNLPWLSSPLPLPPVAAENLSTQESSRYAPSVWACVNTGIGRVRCGLADFHSISRCRN